MGPWRATGLAAAAAALLALQDPAPVDACTTFVLRDGGRVLFGKNYDWSLGEGLLVANPRGLERTSTADPPAVPATWTARYGSVTFNQYGVASPSGGINEAGLVVELMWLEQTRYPSPDGRPAVGNLEWIQYQLDRHATVAEVIASDSAVRIDAVAPLHYLVADRAGNVAVIEFLAGRMRARAGADVPVPALANDPYGDELASWQAGERSRSRFATAGRRALDFRATGDSSRSVAYAFDTLHAVRQEHTQWSIVYDVRAGEVFFRTRGRDAVRRLVLGGLDLSCAAGVRAVDLAAAGPDLAPALRPLTTERHRAALGSAFRQTPFLAQVPEARIDFLAAEPLAARCAAAAR